MIGTVRNVGYRFVLPCRPTRRLTSEPATTDSREPTGTSARPAPAVTSAAVDARAAVDSRPGLRRRARRSAGSAPTAAEDADGVVADRRPGPARPDATPRRRPSRVHRAGHAATDGRSSVTPTSTSPTDGRSAHTSWCDPTIAETASAQPWCRPGRDAGARRACASGRTATAPRPLPLRPSSGSRASAELWQMRRAVDAAVAPPAYPPTT